MYLVFLSVRVFGPGSYSTLCIESFPQHLHWVKQGRKNDNTLSTFGKRMGAASHSPC